MTSKIPGSSLTSDIRDGDKEYEELNKLDKINPYLTVSTFRWQDIIYASGLYDEYF